MISDDEKELFKASMRNVKPLKSSSKVTLKKITPSPINAPRKIQHEDARWLLPYDKDDWLDSKDSLHFCKAGVQNKQIQRLKRNSAAIEARLDLHGRTAAEALSQLERFFDQCLARSLKWICIVHGKGLSSADGKPVIKNLVNQWLRKQTTVLAFQSAQPKDGGTGAVYVLLKSQRGKDSA